MDIKQIRLNGTDYDIRDARIVSGTIGEGETVEFTGSAVLVIGGSIDGGVGFGVLFIPGMAYDIFNMGVNCFADGDGTYTIENIGAELNYIAIIRD